MIEVNDKGVRLEGNLKGIMNDWMNATRFVYSTLAKEIGIKETSNLMGKSMQIAAIDAADELMKKGELPDE